MALKKAIKTAVTKPRKYTRRRKNAASVEATASTKTVNYAEMLELLTKSIQEHFPKDFIKPSIVISYIPKGSKAGIAFTDNFYVSITRYTSNHVNGKYSVLSTYNPSISDGLEHLLEMWMREVNKVSATQTLEAYYNARKTL